MHKSKYDYKAYCNGHAVFKDTEKNIYVVARAKKLPSWAKRNDKDFSDYDIDGKVLFEHKDLKECGRFLFAMLKEI